MGCGSSKGVPPEPGRHQTPGPDASPLNLSGAKPPAASGEAPTDVAALHKQRLEQQQQAHAQTQQLQQHELSLPGRIESTTAPAPPPLLKELSDAEDLPPPGKAPAVTAADAEFNYEKELKHSAVGGGALSSKHHLSPLAGPAQGAVVGGLLSKQPDWLRGSSTETNPAAAGAGAVADGTLASFSANTGPQMLPVAAQSGAAAAAGKTSSLPPLMGRGAAQGPLPPLFPGGARSLAPLEPQPKQQAVEKLSDDGSGSVAAGSGAAAESARAFVDGRVSRSSASGLDDPEATQQPLEQKEGTLQLKDNSSKSSAASSRSSSPAAASHSVAAGGHSLQDTADPWNALSAVYAGSSPSPDSSMAGGSVQAAAPAHNAHAAAQASAAASGPALQNPLGAAGAAFIRAQQQGSRRATGTAAASAQQELVLVDSDDETTAHGVVHKGQERPQQQLNGSIEGLKSGRSSFSAAGGRISAQSSHQSISSVPIVAKSGGWGVGSLAGAGTIMLGNEAASSKGPGRKPGVAAPSAGHDDVFGDEGDEAPIIPKNAAAALVGEGSTSSRARVGGAAGVQDALDVEEIEDDVDALIESEMARDGLPADLAAKLAQFEAMGADGDGDEAPAAGGSGSDSDGPSIYALMNNRQGSWRAA